MMTKEEVLAGLAFIEKYAPEQMRGAIRVARSACEVVRAEIDLDEVRKRPADDLELSVRTAVALAHLGLKTVGAVEEFAALSDEVILARGKKVYFGKKSIKEMREVLGNIGLGRRNGAPS